MKREIRSDGEIRATADQGMVEAYLTKWGSVDSYQSAFAPGAFARTFRERGPGKIRLIGDHGKLAGKVLEVREDDYGPWVRAQFNLDTENGREWFSHVKNGDVDCFSFGFRAIKDRMVKGVREILDVDLFEVGPVVFEANPEALITQIRADDFSRTLSDDDLRRRGRQMWMALEETLDDIRWETPETEWIPLTAKAVEDFRNAYIEWLEDWLARFGASQERTIPAATDMSRALFEASGGDLGDMAMRSEFTVDELRTLRRGDLLEPGARRKLTAHGDIDRAHREARSAKIEALCDEIRSGGLTAAETARISGLIRMHPSDELRTQGTGGDDSLSAMIEYFEKMG